MIVQGADMEEFGDEINVDVKAFRKDNGAAILMCITVSFAVFLGVIGKQSSFPEGYRKVSYITLQLQVSMILHFTLHTKF